MNKEKNIIVRVPDDLKDRFFNYCKINGYSPSKRLRIIIENDIK